MNSVLRIGLVCVILLVLCVLARPQTFGSQVLVARHANLVLIGDIVYMDEAFPMLTTAAHINHQVVVVRVREVLKGRVTGRFVNVRFGFGMDSKLSESVFQKGNRIIILLEQPISRETCTFLGSTDATNIYSEASCHSAWTNAAWLATDEEVAAVKWLVKKR